MKTLTVGICSYQRRDSVLRLVRALDEQARESPDAWRGVDVCVVLDGSDDGSREALDAYDASFALKVIWQPNQGLATARNTVVEAATGEIIWFLDDDLVPAAGTIDRHRQAHEGDEIGFMLGPCLVPDDLDVPDDVREWWKNNYGVLEASGAVERLDQFGVANASAPVAVVRAAGGFNQRFRGYGWEDYEFGARVLALGHRERYDPHAVSWHYTTVDESLSFERLRSEGHGVALTFQLHPELAASYFPTTYTWRLPRLLDRLRVYSPRVLWSIASLNHTIMGPAEWLLRSHAPRFRRVAWETAFLAGIADMDRGLLIQALGRPSSGSPAAKTPPAVVPAP